MKRGRVKDISRERLMDAMLTPRTLQTVAMELGFSSAAISRLWTIVSTEDEQEHRRELESQRRSTSAQEMSDTELSVRIAAARIEKLKTCQRSARSPKVYRFADST